MGRRLCWFLVVLMVCSTVAFSQEPNRPMPGPPRGPEHEVAMRQRHLETEAREMELDFQRQMHQLELEKRKLELQREQQAQGRPKHCGRFGHHRKFPFLAMIPTVCFVVNILLAIWVFQDIRRRNAGSGIWIVVTLLVGFFGALLYVLVRLGDIRQAE